jgi:hypothetical protein
LRLLTAVLCCCGYKLSRQTSFRCMSCCSAVMRAVLSVDLSRRGRVGERQKGKILDFIGRRSGVELADLGTPATDDMVTA